MLKLLCRIIPAVVVAERVRRQVVVRPVMAAAAVSKNMIGLPRTIDCAATDVAPSCGLSENLITHCCRWYLPGGIRGSSCHVALASRDMKHMQEVGELFWTLRNSV